VDGITFFDSIFMPMVDVFLFHTAPLFAQLQILPYELIIKQAVPRRLFIPALQ
jgi:hypothetical protein